MPSASKIKGSGFEREVAKELTTIYGETFIRNINGSGAYVGGKNNSRKENLTESQVRQAKGDIIPPESFALLNVEAKFYGDFGFHQLFDGNSTLDGWLEQLMLAADPGDISILFFKINRRGKYVAVQANQPWNYSSCSYTLYRSSKLGDWMIYSFDNFFNLNTATLKALCNKSKILLETNHIL
jgi:hypothetical protein